MQWSATRPLTKLEKSLLWIFFLGILPAFGALVEYRSAFLTRRMGDLDVFLRAAWAVRTGNDLYSVTSDNDWHYLYPPFYAILMTPLADPPKGMDTFGYVPYPISVAICYLLNVVCLLWAVHVLGSALEQHALPAGPPTYSRRWWVLRMVPVLVCMMGIGHTLMRGQVNLVVLAMLCAAIAGWLHGHTVRAGWWLALGICIKVIPAYLVVYPLWTRDGRAVAGCVAGATIGLVLIPLLVFGPAKTMEVYENYAEAFLGPAFNTSGDDRTHEEVSMTDSIGVKNALHNWTYPDPSQRPAEMHVAGKIAYLLLGFAMTFLTLWPKLGFDRNSNAVAAHRALQLATLVLLMAIFSPVSHRHYLVFCLPVVMCLLSSNWKNPNTIDVSWPVIICFGVFNLGMFLGYLPAIEPVMRDRCGPLFATLPLWILAVAQLWRERTATSVPALDEPGISRKAA